jgi:hypothetical protein
MMLSKLAVARWLTTRQISALCFPGVSLEVARRRLRLLGQERFVHTWRINRMAEALHTLGPAGRSLLLTQGQPHPIRLERRPLQNLEHALGINDLRVAVESSARRDGFSIGFFFACWELQEQGWRYRIIPDAACLVERAGSRWIFAFEYDRGQESPEFIVRTKFKTYAQGLDGFPISRVVMVTEAEARATQLHTYARRHVEIERFAFITRERLLRSWSLTDLL